MNLTWLDKKVEIFEGQMERLIQQVAVLAVGLFCLNVIAVCILLTVLLT